MKYTLLFLISLMVMVSCEEPFDPAFQWESKIVAISYIAPNRDMKVCIASTLDEMGMTSDVENANVYLQVGNERLMLDRDTDLGHNNSGRKFLLSDFMARTNETFKLVIEHEDFPKAVASTAIPDQYCDYSMSYSKESPTEEVWSCSDNVNMSVFFDQLEGIRGKNFNLIVSSVMFSGSIVDPESGETVSGNIVTPLPRNDYKFWDHGIRDFSSGILIAGDEIVEAGGILNLFINVPYQCGVLEFVGLDIELRVLSEEYYQYHKQVSRLYQGNLIQENIFQEPVIGYTNFDNGFGTFGGYNYCTSSIRFN